MSDGPCIPDRDVADLAGPPAAGLASDPSPYDRAQLPRRLAFNQTEFNWYIFEGHGRGRAGSRHLAGLVALHRTGPRVRRIELGFDLITGGDLPSPLRELVPSWLPVVSPLRVTQDDRALLMMALYDLDRGDQPRQVELEVEHGDLDLDTFSAVTRELEVRQFLIRDVRSTLPAGLRAFFRNDTPAARIRARTAGFEFDLYVRPRKDPVWFGGDSPRLRHGTIETSYVQRPRLDVIGRMIVDGEPIDDFVGDGAQDRQWLTVRHPNLKWIWPHLRLTDGTELHGYVIRDSSGGPWLPADHGRELGRGGWLIEADGRVRALRHFDVRALDAIRTDRALVPSRFAIEAPELDLRLVMAHAIPAPFLRMRAFGDVLDGGIWEGPAQIVEANRAIEGHGWVEVMNAAAVRFTGR